MSNYYNSNPSASFTLDHNSAYFQDVPITDDADIAELQLRINGACEFVERYCNRKFAKNTYQNVYTVKQDGSIILDNPPVTSINRICYCNGGWLSLGNSTAWSPAYSTTLTSLVLNQYANGVLSTTTLNYAQYPTLSSLSNAINAVGLSANASDYSFGFSFTQNGTYFTQPSYQGTYLSNPVYLWYTGVNWVVSSVIGTLGSNYWQNSSTSMFGNYTQHGYSVGLIVSNSGWVSSVSGTTSSGYLAANLPTTDIVAFQYGNETGQTQILSWQPYNSLLAPNIWPTTGFYSMQYDVSSGILDWFFPRGLRLLVNYTGGFDPVPESIMLVTSKLVLEASRKKSETLGSYSYTLEDFENLANNDKRILGYYRERNC
jgi:hypothetical protein